MAHETHNEREIEIMKAKYAIEYLQTLDPEQEVIASLFVKDDLDDYNLTDDQWHIVVSRSDNLDWYSDVKDLASDLGDDEGEEL